MTRKEPPDVAILAARIMRAYATLSPYSAASLATELCAIERAQRRHAERCCSGQDGGYVREVHRENILPAVGAHRTYRSASGALCGYFREHDPDAERKAGARVERKVADWLDDVRERCEDAGSPAPTIELQGDPRGPVLLVRFPGEVEAVTA